MFTYYLDSDTSIGINSRMITQFTVGCSRTINLGNYESVRVEAQVVVAVDGGDLIAIKEAAQVELRQLLEETYRAQAKTKERRRDDY